MKERLVEEFGTESLVGALQELFGFHTDMLTPTTTLEELGLDSLALLEMGAFLQERTGVEVGSRLGEVSLSAPLEQVARAVAAALA
ncbi:acyl carrier protein [Streptomyces sp. Go40/10]|uniref:acyl carrier protein n=1 Tax=Streptomyces sp. Go40/10 TaxID=2825844 RepID=UPI001E62425E|nr:acyl carrier protein [Streptomyces sp. Go40/10]UFQ99915.1 acyl carrier protein [Streptomyces sp. Go40/10]